MVISSRPIRVCISMRAISAVVTAIGFPLAPVLAGRRRIVRGTADRGAAGTRIGRGIGLLRVERTRSGETRSTVPTGSFPTAASSAVAASPRCGVASL